MPLWSSQLRTKGVHPARENSADKEFQDAEDDIDEALRISHLLNNHALSALCLLVRADVYRAMGLLGKALADLNALERLYRNEVRDDCQLAIVLARISALLRRAAAIREKLGTSEHYSVHVLYTDGVGSVYSVRPSRMTTPEGNRAVVKPATDEQFADIEKFMEDVLSAMSSTERIVHDEFPDAALSPEAYAAEARTLVESDASGRVRNEVNEILGPV